MNADKRGEKAKYQDLLKKNEPIFDKDGFLYGYDPARERERRKKEQQKKENGEADDETQEAKFETHYRGQGDDGENNQNS